MAVRVKDPGVSKTHLVGQTHFFGGSWYAGSCMLQVPITLPSRKFATISSAPRVFFCAATSHIFPPPPNLYRWPTDVHKLNRIRYFTTMATYFLLVPFTFCVEESSTPMLSFFLAKN
jgi:hypothetical protein